MLGKDSFNPKKLLNSFYHHASKSVSHARKYHALDAFRQKAEETLSAPHHKPFEEAKRNAKLYQVIFISLGLLFLLITFFMYSQTMNWSGSLFFTNYLATKVVVCLTTFALSLSCFILAYFITPQKEAVSQLVHRTEKKLKRIMAYQKAEFGLQKLPFKIHFKKSLACNQALDYALNKVTESKKITYTLLDHIAKDPSLEEDELEKLYNQAILELNDKLHVIIYDFKDKIKTLLT